MQLRSLLIFACLLAQVLAISIVVYKENFAPFENRSTGRPLTSLKRAMYGVCLVAWLLIGFAEYLRP